MGRRIYVASSWRNPHQPSLVTLLRCRGHEVYDFRNPPNGSGGFGWSQIDPEWQSWTPEQYLAALDHPLAIEGFRADFEGMQWADTCVLQGPAGISAHLELGWCAGQGKRTAVLFKSGEPELMVKAAERLFTNRLDLLRWLASIEGEADA